MEGRAGRGAGRELDMVRGDWSVGVVMGSILTGPLL